MSDTPLTEDWLSEAGFKWHQGERQPFKHWVLKIDEKDDCGLYLETTKPGWFNQAGEHVNAETGWFLWLGREQSRFIHLRHIFTRQDMIAVFEAVSGREWLPGNHRYGIAFRRLPAEPSVSLTRGEEGQE